MVIWQRLVSEKRAYKWAAISNCMMWVFAGIVQAAEPDVHHDAIMISLPVFVVSLIATASFTWMVAKYDNERIRRMDKLERKLDIFLRHQTDHDSPQTESEEGS